MKAVWKVAVDLTNVDDVTIVYFPKGSSILSVDNQDECLCVWALVTPSADTVPYKLQVIGTGNLIVERVGSFIGTVLFRSGRFVLHVFKA